MPDLSDEIKKIKKNILLIVNVISGILFVSVVWLHYILFTKSEVLNFKEFRFQKSVIRFKALLCKK